MLVRKGECNRCGGCCNRSVTFLNWPRAKDKLVKYAAAKHHIPEAQIPEPTDMCPLAVKDGDKWACMQHDQLKDRAPGCVSFPERPAQVDYLKAHGYPCSYWFEEVFEPVPEPSEMEVMGP